MKLRFGIAVLVLLAGLAMRGGVLNAGGQLSDTFTNWIDHPAIAYSTRPTTDPVGQLARRVADGQASLSFEGPSGYLRSLLDALNIPLDSQMAVFAKDSVQARIIELGNPRALFFNDTVSVGWVRGGFIEMASQDPQQGVIFYTLDRSLTDKPRFNRQDSGCITCHYSYATAGVPGMLVRSVGEFEVDHRLPLEQRWGGWYVTGQHGSIRHMGNLDPPQLFVSPRPTAFNWPSLEGKFDTSGYLTRHSDIAALMVFEHQMHMMNLLTRIGWESRVAAYEARAAKAATPRAPAQPGGPVSLSEAAREVVDYLLFVDEAPLANTIQGSTTFASDFAARGPRDRKGRSLRELDLKRRLVRYPCSYMIYSEQFDRLPADAKAAIYQRLWQVLSGKETAKKYARLSRDDRTAIVEILRETKSGLPAYFGGTSASSKVPRFQGSILRKARTVEP